MPRGASPRRVPPPHPEVPRVAVSDTAALRPRARPWRVNGRGILWLAAPSAVWYMLFTIGPLLAMFYIALLDWKGLAAKPGWAGVANITRMFSDPRIGTAAITTKISTMAAFGSSRTP